LKEPIGLCGSNGLRLLGSPDVRNAVLLNEIGVLLGGLGRLSKEFITGAASFPHHLILRRLSRGKDPYLGSDADPLSAVHFYLDKINLDAEERAIARLVCRGMANFGSEVSSLDDGFQDSLEEVLGSVREKLSPAHEGAFDQVAGLVRGISANLRWQKQGEESIAAIQPPFISVQALYDGLDRLPFVADLVEMQGRTWHPEALPSPEVKLLRALCEGEELVGRPRVLVDGERLGDVRELCCEVLANQLLEIYNIRKDGPGDLGFWFWEGRLYPQSQEAMALLRRFDEGETLDGEELEAVRWLGVRPITEWAYSKVIVGQRRDGSQMSLWEQTYKLASLHKSAMVRALIEGHWPEAGSLSWRTLRVSLKGPAAEALDRIKELTEVEYPLGNELYRDEKSIHFTFPGLEDEPVAQLAERLRKEIVLVVASKLHPRVSLTPIVEKTSEVLGTSEM
jgi:hypothetical protein